MRFGPVMSGLSDAARPLHFCNEHVSFWMESWPDCLGYLEGATCMAEQPEVQTRRLMSHSGEHPGLSSGQPY